MGELVQFVTPLHQATSRSYIDRMVDDKVHCMLKAKEYESDYWDDIDVMVMVVTSIWLAGGNQ